MRTKSKWWLRTSAGFALLAALSTGHAQTRETLKIGAMLPMSGPGAISGASFAAGAKAAINEINQKGGVLGRQIELVIADDAGDPTHGVNEARRLALVEKVRFVLGSINSNVTLATMPIFTEAKVLQFTSTGAKEATAERGPYHFSTMSVDASAQAGNFVDYAVKTAKVRRVSIISDSTALYRSVVEEAQAQAKPAGPEIVSVGQFEPRDVDMVPQLLAARRANPDLLWVVGILPGDAANVMRSMKDIGWNVPVAVGLGAGAQAKGMLAVLPDGQIPNHVGQVMVASTYCANTPMGEAPLTKAYAMLRATVADYEKMLPGPVLSGYDAIRVMAQAYAGSGTLDTVATADWIERNADKLQSVSYKYARGSKTRHFLVGPDAMAMAENPYRTRADGLSKRVGC